MFRKKSISSILAEKDTPEHKLERVLGPWQMVFLGIGCIIGAGIFSLTGIAAAENAGPAIVLSFILAAFGCLFAGLCYCELATMIPVAGSAYTYAYATMGELVAWIIGWDLILEYAIGASTVAISWSAYVVALLHDLGIYLPTAIIASPWQSVLLPDGTSVYGHINLPALLIVVLLSYLLMRGVRESMIVNTFFVLLKIAVILIFIAIGSFYIQPENYKPFIPENLGHYGEFGWSGVLRAAGVVFFAYIGFDAVSTAAQEVKNPQRDIPFGILGSLLICTVLYIVFSFVLTGMVHYTKLHVAAPVAVAIDVTPHHWVGGLIKLAIVAGFSSVILVLLLGQSRIFYSMAQDGMIPRWMADVHPRWKTPWHANLLLMIFVGAIASFAPIAVVGSMTSIGTLLAFVIVCAGVIVLRKTAPEAHRPFKTPFVPFIPAMGIAVCLLLMFSLDEDNWLRLLIWLAIGFTIYFGYSRRHISRL